MEDKQISPQESVALINAMIENSKHRVVMSDLRISLMWAGLGLVSAIAVFTLLAITRNILFNLLWFAIPLIGIPSYFIMKRKSMSKAHVRTAIDKFAADFWGIVIFIGVATALTCLGFSLAGYHEAWLAMFFYAFIVVGAGAIINGVLFREFSYKFGGIFSILAGFVLMALYTSHVPLDFVWVLPIYILCILFMFVVPAFIISRKLKKENR